MTEQKQKEEPKIPVGLSGNPKITPQIAWDMYFNLKYINEHLTKTLIDFEMQYFKSGDLKYYFKDDLVEKTSLNEKNEEVKYQDLRDDFWTPKTIIDKSTSLIVDSQGQPMN